MNRFRVALCACAVFLGATVFLAIAQDNGAPQAPSNAGPARKTRGGSNADGVNWDGPPVRLDVTVYRLTAASDVAARIDVGALTEKASNSDAFAKTLAELGVATPLCRVDQVVKASEPAHIRVSSDIPIQLAPPANGATQNVAVARQSVGLSLEWGVELRNGPTTPEVAMRFNFDLSYVTDSATDLGGGVHSPVYRKQSRGYSMPYETNKPRVLLAAETAGAKSGEAEFVVMRVVVHEVSSQ